MAAWIVDEFSVKPGGLFTKWRYARVLVDENGVLYVNDVPGKESINLNCISDYSKKSRRYSNDALITTYCNLTTFTRYNVFAQDCRPFAYVTTVLNQTSCGYITPIPQPAVPPTYFGPLLNYGLWKHFDFCNDYGQNVLVNLYRKSFTGTAIEINTGDATPVILSYKTSDDSKGSPIRSLEAKLSFIADGNFDYWEFYTNDEREFKAEVIVDNQVKFMGFVIPDSCSEPFKIPPYPVTIRATDGLNGLKKITYPLPSGSKINLRQTFISILAYCLAKTDLGLEIHTICNLYESKMLNGLNDDPLAQSSVNPLRFTHDNGYIYNIYDALLEVCKLFNGYVAQINGTWHFVRVNELSNSVIRKRVYNSTAFLIRGENIAPIRYAGINEDVEVLEGGEILIGNAYKRVEVMLNYGNMPSIIFNGDFELWDGDNFDFWTRYGGMNIFQIQNTITGVGGVQIPLPNYSLQFDEKYRIDKWLEADPVAVLPGDKITFSFNIGDTKSKFARFKMRVKAGQYYLYNSVVGVNDNYEWVNSLATVTVDAFNQGGSVNNFILSISAPPVPIDASTLVIPLLAPQQSLMVIQLLGFSQMIEYSGSIFGLSVPLVKEDANYSPILLDNFSIKKTADIDKTTPDSSYNVSSQLGFYTEVPDLIETIFGDYQEIGVGSASGSVSIIKRDLYAIYTADKSYSKGWYSYGQTNSPLPINLYLSKDVLNAYQKPFRFYSGGLLGANFSYLDTFNIIVTGNADFSERIFTWLNVDFDLKKNTAEGMLVEIFSKNVVSTQITVPINPGQQPPKINGIRQGLLLLMGTPGFVNNPNNPTGVPTIGGPFDDEFTTEFL